jgi:hypothetical protein
MVFLIACASHKVAFGNPSVVLNLIRIKFLIKNLHGYLCISETQDLYRIIKT